MTEERFHLDLTALFEPAPEGGYVARFAELPDVFSEGETLEEARANLFDALQLVMDYHREQMERHENPTGTSLRWSEQTWPRFSESSVPNEACSQK